MKLATAVKIIAAIALTLAVLPSLSLAETITATGTVTDANGNPVSGAKVSLIDDSYRVFGATTTDTNGNFRFYNVTPQGSNLVKAFVTYEENGQNYSTRLENVRWLDVSGNMAEFPVNDTRLYGYPVSDHGYIWGNVIESQASGRGLDATVYLNGNGIHRSVQTGSNSASGTFEIEVPPGEYTIYAVHGTDSNRQFSNRTTITIVPASSVLDSAPITLIADQKQTSLLGDIKLMPFALAIVIGVLLLVIGWSLLNKE